MNPHPAVVKCNVFHVGGFVCSSLPSLPFNIGRYYENSFHVQENEDKNKVQICTLKLGKEFQLHELTNCWLLFQFTYVLSILCYITDLGLAR